MSEKSIEKLAVIGAGNMGSGIAQKMASEGFDVTLIDLDDEKVQRGMEIIRTTLAEGVERKIFSADQADAIQTRIHGSANWSDLADVDLVVEAVFEDLGVKRNVFERLEEGRLDASRFEGFLKLEDEIAKLRKSRKKRQLTVTRRTRRDHRDKARKYDARAEEGWEE